MKKALQPPPPPSPYALFQLLGCPVASTLAALLTPRAVANLLYTCWEACSVLDGSACVWQALLKQRFSGQRGACMAHDLAALRRCPDWKGAFVFVSCDRPALVRAHHDEERALRAVLRANRTDHLVAFVQRKRFFAGAAGPQGQQEEELFCQLMELWVRPPRCTTADGEPDAPLFFLVARAIAAMHDPPAVGGAHRQAGRIVAAVRRSIECGGRAAFFWATEQAFLPTPQLEDVAGLLLQRAPAEAVAVCFCMAMRAGADEDAQHAKEGEGEAKMPANTKATTTTTTTTTTTQQQGAPRCYDRKLAWLERAQSAHFDAGARHDQADEQLGDRPDPGTLCGMVLRELMDVCALRRDAARLAHFAERAVVGALLRAAPDLAGVVARAAQLLLAFFDDTGAAVAPPPGPPPALLALADTLVAQYFAQIAGGHPGFAGHAARLAQNVLDHVLERAPQNLMPCLRGMNCFAPHHARLQDYFCVGLHLEGDFAGSCGVHMSNSEPPASHPSSRMIRYAARSYARLGFADEAWELLCESRCDASPAMLLENAFFHLGFAPGSPHFDLPRARQCFALALEEGRGGGGGGGGEWGGASGSNVVPAFDFDATRSAVAARLAAYDIDSSSGAARVHVR